MNSTITELEILEYEFTRDSTEEADFFIELKLVDAARAYLEQKEALKGLVKALEIYLMAGSKEERKAASFLAKRALSRDSLKETLDELRYYQTEHEITEEQYYGHVLAGMDSYEVKGYERETFYLSLRTNGSAHYVVHAVTEP